MPYGLDPGICRPTIGINEASSWQEVLDWHIHLPNHRRPAIRCQNDILATDGVRVHLPLKHCKPQKVGANQEQSRAWNIQSMDKTILEGRQSRNSRDLLFLDKGRQRKATLQV